MKKIFGVLIVLAMSASAQQWRTAYYFQPNASVLPVTAAPFSKYTHVTQANVLATYDSGTNTCGLDTTSYGISGNTASFVNAVHAAGAKALITLMGDSAHATQMQTCTSPANINQFVSVISSFVTANGYDGFDLDWEDGIVDAQWQSFIVSLRTAMPGKLLTVAVTITDRFNVAAVQSSLDQANIMNYDRDVNVYSGAYATDTWYTSAILAGGDVNHPTAEQDVAYYIGAGVAAGKIGIGMPFYGRIKTGCVSGSQSGSTCTQGVDAPYQVYASGDASTNPRGAINYNALLNSSYWSSGTQIWDAAHGSQYIQYTAGGAANAAFIPFTGTQQIQSLVSFVQTNNLGGAMTYELSYEYIASASGDSRYPLSTALYQDMSGASGVAAPSITTVSPLASATVGTAYSAVLSATGNGPVAWSLASGSLPAGLALAASTGGISGMPTTAGTFTFTIQASNSIGGTTRSFSLAVHTSTTPPSGTAPVITNTSPLPAGNLGAAYSMTVSATGTGPVTWSLPSGSLPPGLFLGASTGVISGTPKAAGTFTFAIRASNSVGSSMKSFSLTMNPSGTAPVITSVSPLPAGRVNAAYSMTVSVTGTGPIAWSLPSGSLPPGLYLAADTGAITGTPTTAGTFTFTIQASNSSGSMKTSFSLVISALPRARHR